MAVLTAKLSLSRPALKEHQLIDLAHDLAKRLLKKQMPKEKVRKLMTFLRHYVDFENKEMLAKFEQGISILTKRSTTMGIEEFLLDQAEKKGRKEGREEERREVINETVLKLKKSGIDVALIANIMGLSVEEVEKLS